jgi:transcription-repair coupling factor (superfamily II helicase)
LAQNRTDADGAALIERALKSPAVQDLLRRMEKGGMLSLGGVSPGAQAFLCAFLHHYFPARAVVAVTTGRKTQEILQQDVETWLRFFQPVPAAKTASDTPAPRTAFFYPAWESLPHEGKLPHIDVISDRLNTLDALLPLPPAPGKPGASAPVPVIVTTVSALMQRTFSPDALRKRTRVITRGDHIEPGALAAWLEEQGYEPEAKVTQPGELSLRGGILDLYPLTAPQPVRLEFFGDDLDSLRWFDPSTQISTGPLEKILLPPGGELGVLRQMELQAREQGRPIEGLGAFTDYLPAHSLVLLFEPDLLEEQAALYEAQIPAKDPFFIPWNQCRERFATSGWTMLELSELAVENEDMAMTSLDAYRPMETHAPDPQVAEAQRLEFFAQLHRWIRQGYAVRVFCNNAGELQRFKELWEECSPDTSPEPPGPDTIETFIGTLSRGFLLNHSRLVVVTDAEVFGRYRVPSARRLKSPQARVTRSALEIDFTELEEGDYVVHLQHGIGRYCGLQVMPFNATRKRGEDVNVRQKPGEGQECLVIEYAASSPDQEPPRLYVPVTEAHLVGKYVGAGKARPPLNTLGGTRWAKARAQAEHAVRDLASELLSIQAARAAQMGHPFPPDTPWQREFESAFLYEETPDQQKAILETKADMENPKPMDRLICGDVGFGKTEVALRAVFKTVMSGKQAAVLVPTTVLAQQHFNTFRERMADYPVRIELLSRYRTHAQQRRAVQDLANGSVDVVIGTHRLIQDDITFKDLGLVVIDEEQRFGVLHKERFKRLRHLVDVLTLSATPIPRTLYLALTGARDMSTIETPPHDRLPVETQVIAYDERVIRDAILREINRQGQVFFLHNRVATIGIVADRLRALVPQARLVVGHGQMESDELEDIMSQFINGQADVLVSTTIIESGLDIPNANTIIIDRADRFGLSDLYQLRGRVGRYKHQAYAYLLLPRHAGLLTDARKRLSAIKQYSSLGSGFKIAMRDLEIRGAGNLLGPEQSGHITAVGFELYCQLLKQSVSALKGEPVKKRIDVSVRIDFIHLQPGIPALEEVQKPAPQSKDQISIPRDVATWYSEPAARPVDTPTPVRHAAAFVPYGYVPDDRQRVEIYRKLAQASDHESLAALKNECRDRFGPLPESLELLLAIAELKILAAGKGVSEIETRLDKLMLKRNKDYIMLGEQFPRLTKKTAAARLKEIKKLLLAL